MAKELVREAAKKAIFLVSPPTLSGRATRKIPFIAASLTETEEKSSLSVRLSMNDCHILES